MKKLLLISITFAIFSCSFPATKEGMTLTNYSSSRAIGEKIYVKEAIGGSRTLPFWISKISNEDFTGALEESLLNSKTFLNVSKKWDEDWALEAEIIRVKTPFIGIDFDVETQVKYTLYNKGKKMFENVVVGAGTGGLGEAFFAAKRLRIANEKSAKSNIKKFIKELEKADFNRK